MSRFPFSSQCYGLLFWIHRLTCTELMKQSLLTFELFTVYTKLAQMAILASKDLRTPKKKLPPDGARPGNITGLCFFFGVL